MYFLIRETLSFNLMYVAACYPVGTTISKLAHFLLLCCSTIGISKAFDMVWHKGL